MAQSKEIVQNIIQNGHRVSNITSHTTQSTVQNRLISAAGAVISQVGDLSASAIKRNHDIKDYGKIIPGHGGIIDRFDSVLFTAPVIYFLSVILLGAVH